MTSTAADTGPAISTTTIAGIVIGVVAGIALLTGACIYSRRLRGGRGRFTTLRKGRALVNPEEEFVSREPSFRIHDRGYGFRQQPSVSLEPLIPSPPETYTVSGPPSLRDAPYLPYPIDHVLPPIDLGPSSLHEADDPYSRIQRAILPVSRTHHMSSRRQPHELDQLSMTSPKHSGPSPPLFINRTLTRALDPEISSGRTISPLFSSADLPQFVSSRRASDPTQSFESHTVPMSNGNTGPSPQSKLRRVISETALSERTILTRSREEIFPPQRFGGETFGAQSAEFIAPETFTPYTPYRQSRTSSPKFPRSPKLPGLSPVAENSTMTDLPPSHDMITNTEIVKKPSLSLSELQKSSSLSVSLSHNGHSTGLEPSSFALLASNNTFGKTDSSASSQRWTTCSSSGRTTRYPSLAPSSLGLSSSNSNSNHHSELASEWRSPPAGLAALTNIQSKPTKPIPSSGTPWEIHDLPLPHTPRPSPSAAASPPREATPHKAHLRAHTPRSVPAVEWRAIVQGDIANIDVTL